MKEQDIKGLEELRSKYAKRLLGVEEYKKLSDEFQRNAMSLVRDALKAKGINMQDTYFGVASQEAACGFCTYCITPCVHCVAYMSSPSSAVASDISTSKR